MKISATLSNLWLNTKNNFTLEQNGLKLRAKLEDSIKSYRSLLKNKSGITGVINVIEIGGSKVLV